MRVSKYKTTNFKMRKILLLLLSVPCLSFAQLDETNSSLKTQDLSTLQLADYYVPRGLDSMGSVEFGSNPLYEYVERYYYYILPQLEEVSDRFIGADSSSFSQTITQEFEDELFYTQKTESKMFISSEGMDAEMGSIVTILKFPRMSTQNSKNVVGNLVKVHSYEYPEGDFPEGIDGWDQQEVDHLIEVWTYVDPNLADKMFTVSFTIINSGDTTTISRLYKWSMGC